MNSSQSIKTAEIYDHQQRKIVAESDIKFLKDISDGYNVFPVGEYNSMRHIAASIHAGRLHKRAP